MTVTRSFHGSSYSQPLHDCYTTVPWQLSQSARGVFARPDHAPLLAARIPPRNRSEELIEAILAGSTRRAQTLLQQRADPETTDARGHTALMNACAHSSAAFVTLLLEAGVDVEAQTRNGSRAVHLASRVDARSCVSKLLETGADPTARRADGKKAVALAQQRSRLLRMLKVAETSWAQKDRLPVPRPSLVHAIALGNDARIVSLLEARAHPNSVDEHGTAALHAACARGKIETVEQLLHAGATANLAVADQLGSRPLHCAAFSGSQARRARVGVCHPVTCPRGCGPNMPLV